MSKKSKRQFQKYIEYYTAALRRVHGVERAPGYFPQLHVAIDFSKLPHEDAVVFDLIRNVDFNLLFQSIEFREMLKHRNKFYESKIVKL